MPMKGDLVIGLAVFARSIVSCDASLLAVEGAANATAGARSGRGAVLTAPGDVPPHLRHRHFGSLSQDPARNRPRPEPLPRALYEIYPVAA